MTGYDVSSRVKVVGKRGIIYEINLVATRWTEIIAIECKYYVEESIAIECKYYVEERTVGIKELIAFHGKLQDLQGIRTTMYDKLY